MSQNSLAQKIILADLNSNNKKQDDLNTREESIASRFSDFSKLMSTSNDQPTKAKKTKSFTILKIGDDNQPKRRKFIKDSNNKCINCTSASNPPYKFYKDGIFELGNSGFLCNLCSDIQSRNDI